MQFRAGVGLVVWACARVASAEPAAPAPRDYPLAQADRPLVLPAGLTTVDVSEDLATYVSTTTDAAGHVVTTTTSLGHDHDLDLTVAHAFGPAQVTLEVVGQFASVDVAALLPGQHWMLSLGATYILPQGTLDYSYVEGVAANYKAVVVPHRLALGGGVGAQVNEFSEMPVPVSPTSPPADAGSIVSVNAGGGPELQLTQRVCLLLGARVTAVVSRPAAEHGATPSFSASSEVLVAFRRWDLYAALELENLSRTAHPFAALGAVRRFGL